MSASLAALDTSLVTAPIFQLQVAAVIVPEDRQRKKAEPDETLLSSIRTNGVLNPIIVREGRILVAGERRLAACRQLEMVHIPARNFEDLTPDAAFLIELQENLARRQLTWQEECAAAAEWHKRRVAAYPGWTQFGTATDLGLHEATISIWLAVARELDDPAVFGCGGLKAAYSFISSRAQRAVVAARVHGMQFGEAINSVFEPPASKDDITAALVAHAKGEAAPPTPQASTITLLDMGRKAAEFLQKKKAEMPSASLPAGPILNTNFLEWAESYSDTPFDVIHCDFPYGKGYSGANTTQQAEHSQPLYDDSKEVFFDLLQGFLRFQNNFVAPQAHCIFWHDRMHEEVILNQFKIAGWQHCSFNPLIWTKGNAGAPGDYRNSYRHCYETAHLFSRGGRTLVKMVQDHFPHPVDEDKLHLSQKPVPMLKHFLSGICDEHTRVLDPTCGSGSAIAAANLLQVDYAMGIELDPANATIARFFVERRTAEGSHDA